MITTFQQHLQNQQKDVSEASGTFSYVLAGTTLAAFMVGGTQEMGPLAEVLGR